MNKQEFNHELNRYLTESGLQTGLELQAGPEQLEQFWTFQEYLLSENQKYNLTAIDQPEEVIRKHFLDSLALVWVLELSGSEKIIDVGTGAGFPGLVLKIIYPEIQLILLDSLSKRIKFLNRLIARLGLKGVEAIHARAEELGRDSAYRDTFDLVVSRAVAAANTLCEYTIPLARVGGRVALYKGPDFQAELEGADQAITLLGGELLDVQQVDVPGIQGERFIVLIDKVSGTPDKYPRRPGMPKKRPL